MISIQTFGTEIAQSKPRSFYAFCGSEYGVKMKYLSIISGIYSGRKVEMDSVDKVLTMMSVKRILPLQPSLYIIRYDEAFMKDADKYVSRIQKAKIIGTITVLFDSPAAEGRLEKYIPDNIVVFDPVDKRFIFKYLRKDFPDLSDITLNEILKTTTDYINAYNVCRSMINLDPKIRNALSESEIKNTFCVSQSVDIDSIKYGIAARDARYCLDIISRYDGQSDAIIYSILSALLEIEKCLTYKNTGSYANKHIKVWNIFDVQSMFNSMYDILMKSRTVGGVDLLYGIKCIICSMCYSPIPKFEI